MERIRILDHGYLELVEAWGSDESVICAARQSTQKGFLGWGGWTCSECGTIDDSIRERLAEPRPVGSCGHAAYSVKPGDEKLLRFLWENRHSTPFEFAGATFEVKAPIFVFREWHRHRVPFGYSEASARYAPLPDENYVPEVARMLEVSKTNRQAGATKGAVELNADVARQAQSWIKSVYGHAETAYQEMLKRGVPKEVARVVLPVGRYSTMRATSNLRGWMSFLTLRQAPNAQFEIRQYADALAKMLEEKFPRTMALFNESRAAR